MPRVSPTSRSAQVNSAAKDDYIMAAANYSVASLLSNDPGSARFYEVIGATLNSDGTISVDDGVYSFDYTVQMANGTYSTATVHIGHEVDGPELLVNGSFEDPVLTSTWEGFDAIDGWTSTGATLEIVQDGYLGISGPDGDQWLDTQASPGGIAISQDVELDTGAEATVEVTIAAQQGAGLETDPDEVLHILFNGVEVGTITTADLGDFNTFHTFEFDVVGADGTDTLEIQSDGAVAAMGFALDAVSLQTSTVVYG